MTILTTRFLCVLSALMVTYIIDAGIDYFSTHFKYMITGTLVRALLLTLLWVLIFGLVKTCHHVIRKPIGNNLFKILSISDIIFIHSFIIFMFFFIYFGFGDTSNVSIADRDGELVHKGEFTLLGLHKAVAHLATMTFSAIFLHFIFLLHALWVTRGTRAPAQRS